MLQQIIDRARRVVFFGGAGVSTASGIPDFRSADGLYQREYEGLTPEMILSQSFFYLHPEHFFNFYRRFMLHPEAKPNAAHRCMDCNAFYPMEAVLRAEGIPRCKRCGGVIKPWVVLYGEAPDKYTCMGACREISNCDTLIVAGTSLSVEPAASFLDYFHGRSLVVINREPTPADARATLTLRGDVGEILQTIKIK